MALETRTRTSHGAAEGSEYEFDSELYELLEQQVREWAAEFQSRDHPADMGSSTPRRQSRSTAHPARFPDGDEDAVTALRACAAGLDKKYTASVEQSLLMHLSSVRARFHAFQLKFAEELRRQEEFRLVLAAEREQRLAAATEMFLATRDRIIAKFTTCVRVFRSLRQTSNKRGLSPDAVLELKLWLFRHFTYPYPTPVEKEELMRKTGLNLKQVDNWFINMRVRICQPLMQAMRPPELPRASHLAMEGASKLKREPSFMESASAQGHNNEDLLHLDMDEGTWIAQCDLLTGEKPFTST